MLYAILLLYLLSLLVAVQSCLAVQKIYFFQHFYFILFQIKKLIKLLYEICYLFHQVMVLLRLFLKTSCMLYVSLLVLLTVKSLVFNFQTVYGSDIQFHPLPFPSLVMPGIPVLWMQRPLFIPDNVIPAIILADLQYSLRDIQSIRRYNDRKTGKSFFDLFCKAYKCLALTVLLHPVITLADIFLRVLYGL